MLWMLFFSINVLEGFSILIFANIENYFYSFLSINFPKLFFC